VTALPRRALAWIRRALRPRRSRLELFVADARITSLIDVARGIERVASGFGFVEGPVWVAEDHALLFSDIPNNRIHRLVDARRTTVFRAPSHNSNGLTRDASGRLIACEHGLRRVTRTEPTGAITVLADRYGGRRLNSPNDVVEGPDGAIYFTDPPYGIPKEAQEQPCQGVYRVLPAGSSPELVADDFVRPNGLAFSPDRTTLYIADSSARRHVRRFAVESDGTLRGGEVFVSMAAAPPGVPDGMKVDSEGNLFCTGPGGIWVIDPQGRHLGSIIVPETAANCAWGGADWRDLFITASSSVYRIKVRIPGVSLPLPHAPFHA
jgi:gluconolactonase